MLVSSSSATHGRPWENDPHFNQAIDRSHSDLVKYSRKDQEYHIVLEYLRDASRSAERVIRFRFPELIALQKSQSASPKAFSNANPSGDPVVIPGGINSGYATIVSSRYIHIQILREFLTRLFGPRSWHVEVSGPPLPTLP